MHLLADLARWDLAATAGSNRVNRHHGWGLAFAVTSRLGDGWFWYGLAAVMLGIDGLAALPLVVLLTAAGLSGSLLYKLLKHGIRRPRPCDVHRMLLTVAPLDRFSFPSGHTLHAVIFSVILTAQMPALAWVVWPFTAMVAASRLVLGLHYPSDVIAGAGIGALWAGLALSLFGMLM
jgi:undecaprenyl-diphosphatase